MFTLNLANPILRGAVSGAFAAAVVDVHAVTSFKNWGDLESYDWGTASFRWLQGALTGGLAGAGFGVMS